MFWLSHFELNPKTKDTRYCAIINHAKNFIGDFNALALGNFQKLTGLLYKENNFIGDFNALVT